MKDDSFIVSGFAHDVHSEAPLVVDFTKAKQLNKGGSTCDAYECIIQRRRVFVKRLKSQYRDNPLYRAAFDKEYDLGVSLSHPSLPHYVGLGNDYMVMDFIEGDTLADLIKRHDPRLNEKVFVKKLLLELIEVVEYLHNRHIVHCDIKADNIIISPYKDRPITLIDLDKAYTAWLGDTPGDPARYDCYRCDDGVIDFRGIGKIADTLGQRHVATICRNNETTVAGIRKAVAHNTGRNRILMWAIPVAVVFSCVIAFLLMNEHAGEGKKQESLTIQSLDTAVIEHNNELPELPIIDDNHNDDQPKHPAEIDEPNHESSGQNSEMVKVAPADDSKDVDDIVRQYYGPLYKRHNYLRQLAANPKASANDLLISIRSYAKDQEIAQGRILKRVIELYGVGDPAESINIVGDSKEWSRFMTEDAEINRLYSREMKKREAVDTLRH